MIVLNALPAIVTEIGEYQTRAGDRVTVSEISPAGDSGCTSFRVKGSVWREYRGKYKPMGYAIWHISGRKYPLREARTDIVGRWESK